MPTLTHLFSRRAINALFSIVSFAAAFAATPLAAQLGLGLSPMRLEMRFPESTSQGGTQSGSLTLTNNSGGKARVRAEILDFYLDNQETPQFNRSYAQESQFSCRNWLSVNPMETEVEAGASFLVRYTIRVPAAAAERGYHCAAGFTTLPPVDQITGTALKTAVRVVAAFYVAVGSPKIDGGLGAIQLERVNEGGVQGWRAVVTMHNPGSIHYRPVGKLEVVDSHGKVIETRDLNAIPVLPKRDQRFLVPLESKMNGGNYTLRARVDIGTQEIQEGSINVTPIATPGPTRMADDGKPAVTAPVAATSGPTSGPTTGPRK